jgi:hypothetical protein
MSYHLAVLQQLAKLAHTAQCIALLLLVPLRHGRSCRRIAVARAGVCTCRDRSCRRVYRCVVVADAAVCAAMSWSLVPACALPCVPAYRGRSCRRVRCRVRHRVMVARAGVCAAMCASVSWLLMPVCALPCAPLCRGRRCCRVRRRVVVARAGVCAAMCAGVSWSLVPACALPCVLACRGCSCQCVRCRVRRCVAVADAAMCAGVSWSLVPACAPPCAPLCRGRRCCHVCRRVVVARAGMCAGVCAPVSWSLVLPCALACAPACRSRRCCRVRWRVVVPGAAVCAAVCAGVSRSLVLLWCHGHGAAASPLLVPPEDSVLQREDTTHLHREPKVGKIRHTIIVEHKEEKVLNVCVHMPERSSVEAQVELRRSRSGEEGREHEKLKQWPETTRRKKS